MSQGKKREMTAYLHHKTSYRIVSKFRFKKWKLNLHLEA